MLWALVVCGSGEERHGGGEEKIYTKEYIRTDKPLGSSCSQSEPMKTKKSLSSCKGSAPSDPSLHHVLVYVHTGAGCCAHCGKPSLTSRQTGLTVLGCFNFPWRF